MCRFVVEIKLQVVCCSNTHGPKRKSFVFCMYLMVLVPFAMQIKQLVLYIVTKLFGYENNDSSFTKHFCVEKNFIIVFRPVVSVWPLADMMWQSCFYIYKKPRRKKWVLREYLIPFEIPFTWKTPSEEGRAARVHNVKPVMWHTLMTNSCLKKGCGTYQSPATPPG